MRTFKLPALFALALFAGQLPPGSGARAQDTAPSGEPIDPAVNPAALTYDYLVDGRLDRDDPVNRKFRTLQAAYAVAPAGTPERPTVIGIVPNVYHLPGTATGASLNITKDYLTLLGLTNNRRAVVLADNRGNKQGGGNESVSNNGYVIVVNATGFTAKNLTILNYCNVDYEYPGDPAKNLTKRSAVITQAGALMASGDKHVYENVALLSRLDTMFLRSTRSYFKNVFIEGTHDFVGGGVISVWADCEIQFPTGNGVMAASGIVFINTKIVSARGMQFYKGARSPVALINCVVPVYTSDAPVAWVRGLAPPRPNLYSLTYRTQDAKGSRAVIADSSVGPATFSYARELSEQEALAFNPWNLLRATPTGVADDWDPAGARTKYEQQGQGGLIYRMALTGGASSVRTGGSGATIGASVSPLRAPDQSISWSTPSDLIALSRTKGSDVVVTGRNPGLPQYVPVNATAANGFRVTAWVFVEPAYLAPPTLASGPALSVPAGGQVTVSYAYDLGDREDQSLITWFACDDAGGANPREVAVSRGGLPLRSYPITPGDVGKFLRVGIQPKHNISDPGPAVFAIAALPIAAADLGSSTVSPNFRNFVTNPNPVCVHGRWTVLGDWTSVAGESLVNGYGIRAASQGAMLLYQNDARCGDMQIELSMTPEKTEGTGFGSPGSSEDGDRIQKSDIFIKYDPRTRTGYSLRYWRTTQSTERCMFQLFRIVNGAGSPLSARQVLSGVFKPSTQFVLKVSGERLTVRARNDVDDDTLDLEGRIAPNDFGGAGVAWYGTVPRGNSNVYSRFAISYPDTAAAPGGRGKEHVSP
jgi:hypothetical protein